MLEALVSSRIRRALFEHILAHPQERFYLRGLAKQLQVSISPLRRELKRLEQTGVLAAAEEGSMRFYAVHTGSPVFLQLQHASEQAVAPSPATAAREVEVEGSGLGTTMAPSPQPSRHPLVALQMIGLAFTVIALVAGLAYSWMANRRLIVKDLQTLQADVTLVVPPGSSSGAMRGQRWQIVPGGFGGFSAASTTESF